jgi:hypothetical protein
MRHAKIVTLKSSGIQCANSPTSKKQIDLDIAGLIRDSEFVRNSKTEPIAITEVFESSATKLETRFCLCFFLQTQ